MLTFLHTKMDLIEHRTNIIIFNSIFSLHYEAELQPMSCISKSKEIMLESNPGSVYQ